MRYLRIPGTDERIVEGSIVTLRNLPYVKQILHYGWYRYDGSQHEGWYLVSVPDGIISPLHPSDIPDISVFDDQDDRYIRVKTIAERDAIDTSILPDKRIVRVDDVDGTPKYYSWSIIMKNWEELDIVTRDDLEAALPRWKVIE